MTAQQAKTINHINEDMATERHNADQAGREVAQLDVLSVHLVVKAKIEAGLVDEAKAIVKAWKAGQL